MQAQVCRCAGVQVCAGAGVNAGSDATSMSNNMTSLLRHSLIWPRHPCVIRDKTWPMSLYVNVFVIFSNHGKPWSIPDCFQWLWRTADHLPHPTLIKIWQGDSTHLRPAIFLNFNSSITSSLYDFARKISKSEAKRAKFMFPAQKLRRKKMSSRFLRRWFSWFVLAIMFHLKNKVKSLFKSVWC